VRFETILAGDPIARGCAPPDSSSLASFPPPKGQVVSDDLPRPSCIGLCSNSDSLLLEQRADLLNGDIGVDDRADLRLRVVCEGMLLVDATQCLDVGHVGDTAATAVGEPAVRLEVLAVAVVSLTLRGEQTRQFLHRRTRKSLKESGRRCRIGAEVFVVGVSGRPRGAPQTKGDDPRCSTWFP
jgi:hypothetical protein